MIDSAEYFFRIVEAAHLASTCSEVAGGAVIARGGDVLIVARADAPGEVAGCHVAGHRHVTERRLAPDPEAVGGRSWQDLQRCVRPIHAEAAAIAQAVRRGVSVAGTTLYCSSIPCHECAQILVASGIAEVRAALDREDTTPTRALLAEARVRLVIGTAEVAPTMT